MSMNFSEFKKLLGADPLNRDPGTLRARDSSPEFEGAAEEAENFERKLHSALAVNTPADSFLEGILDIPGSATGQVATRPRWFAIAASVSGDARHRGDKLETGAPARDHRRVRGGALPLRRPGVDRQGPP